MRIVLLSDWFLPRLGGLELHLKDLAERLALRGHEVHVVTSTPADPAVQGRLQSGELAVEEGVSVRRLPVPVLPGVGLALSPAVVPEVAEALEQIRPDVVHVHAGVVPPLALAGGWAAHRAGLPVVVTFHSMLGPVRPAWRASEVLLRWSRWADVLSGVGPGVAREIRRVVPGREVEVLPNGIDPETWRVDRRPGSPGELRLVAVQRLQRRKRGEALLRVVAGAARRLAPRGVRVRLTVAGEGPRRGSLEALAERLGPEGSVRFAGYLPRVEVRELLGGSDAFLLLSVHESFGLSALEARAAGVPVLARADSGVADLLQDGSEALLGRSDGEVEDHLVAAGSRPEILADMRRHLAETPTPFAWEVVIETHLDAYERAVRSGPVRGSAAGLGAL